MTVLEVEKVQADWSALEQVLFVPHTEAEYDQLVEMLDALIDTVGENESHPLASLMEVIGVLMKNTRTKMSLKLPNSVKKVK